MDNLSPSTPSMDRVMDVPEAAAFSCSLDGARPSRGWRSWLARWWPEALILLVALLFRVVALEIKPPHFDEGVNGFFVDWMIRQGFYHYDPTNFHGPLHFYVLFLMQSLFGRHIWALRLPVALFSLACVGLMLAYRRFFGTTTARVAATAMALSPAMTFYGRYAIHESFLLLSLMLTVWGLLGLYRDGQRRDLWAAALGLTGMILTKETYAIHVIALGLALPAMWVLERWSPSESELRTARQCWNEEDLKWVGAVCVGALLFFYSGALLDWTGVPGLWTTFFTWTKTGMAEEGQAKPWDYWIELMAVYEWPALIALIGSVAIAAPVRGHKWLLGLAAVLAASSAYPIFVLLRWDPIDWFVRFKWPILVAVIGGLAAAVPQQSRSLRYLVLTGFASLSAYTIIRYKTPWCIIVLLWPFYLFLGMALENARGWRVWLLRAMIALVLGHSGFQAWRLNFVRYADEKEPYVYVQTQTTLRKLMAPLEALLREDKANYQLRGHILTEAEGDTHPLPWLLGDFPHISYLHAKSPPGSDDEMSADFLLIEDAYVSDVEERLRERYFRETFTLRGNSGQEFTLYWKASVFRHLFRGREPEFEPLKASLPGLPTAEEEEPAARELRPTKPGVTAPAP